MKKIVDVLYVRPAVETLIRKHGEFSKLLESQMGKVLELEKYAESISEGHYNRDYIMKRVAAVRARADQLKVAT